MAISMFFAPVWTTSRSDLTVNEMVASRSKSSLWFRSRNSRTVLLDLPIAFAFLQVVSSDSNLSVEQPTKRNRYPRALSGTASVPGHLYRNQL